jgi:hypothetical protein
MVLGCGIYDMLEADMEKLYAKFFTARAVERANTSMTDYDIGKVA